MPWKKLIFEILGTLTAHKAKMNKMRLELRFQTFDKKEKKKKGNCR